MALTARLCESVRAGGTYISGTNGTSNGIVPMLRVYNQTARFVNQGGGKRMGSFAVYIEPWHADIFEFLDLRKNHGKEEVSFQWTNPDFLFKNPDLLIRNPDFLLKNVDFIIITGTRPRPLLWNVSMIRKLFAAFDLTFFLACVVACVLVLAQFS